MRILIITHPRSGGLSLMSWIGKELNYGIIHEPHNTNTDDLLRSKTEPNVVVKIFTYHNLGGDFMDDIHDYIKLFDKIIFHKRENIKDVAISNMMMEYTDDFHKTYNVTDEIINSFDSKKMNDLIYDVNISLNNINKLIENYEGIQTTYDGIYETCVDIDKIINYLGIESPKWIDMVDKRHRLKNGKIGMSDMIGITPTPIPPPQTSQSKRKII